MGKRFKCMNPVLVKLYRTDAAVLKKMGETFTPIVNLEENFMDFGGLEEYQQSIFPPIPKEQKELESLIPDAAPDASFNTTMEYSQIQQKPEEKKDEKVSKSVDLNKV